MSQPSPPHEVVSEAQTIPDRANFFDGKAGREGVSEGHQILSLATRSSCCKLRPLISSADSPRRQAETARNRDPASPSRGQSEQAALLRGQGLRSRPPSVTPVLTGRPGAGAFWRGRAARRRGGPRLCRCRRLVTWEPPRQRTFGRPPGNAGGPAGRQAGGEVS